MKWVIKTWDGRPVVKNERQDLWEFDSYEEARAFVDDYAERTSKDEEERETIAGDLYAIKKSEYLARRAQLEPTWHYWSAY